MIIFLKKANKINHLNLNFLQVKLVLGDTM